MLADDRHITNDLTTATAIILKHDPRIPEADTQTVTGTINTDISGARTFTSTMTFMSLPRTTVTTQPTTMIEPSATATSATTTRVPDTSKGVSIAAFAAIAVCVTLALICGALAGWYFYRRHQRATAMYKIIEDDNPGAMLLESEMQVYDRVPPPSAVLYQKCPFCTKQQNDNVICEAPFPPVELICDQPDPCLKFGLVMRNNGARMAANSRRGSCKF